MPIQGTTDGAVTLRTRDLPLAAFLTLHGVKHTSMERQGRVGYWVFPRSERTEHLVAEYRQGEVTIDLSRFMDCVAEVRSDLYAFLDID